VRKFDEARNQAALGGPSPAAAAFVFGEKVVDRGAIVAEELIRLNLPPNDRRRIYCHVEAQLGGSSSDYYVICEVELRKAGQSRATLRADIGLDANPNYLTESLVNFFPNPAQAGANAILVVFQQFWAGGTDGSIGSLVLTPYEMDISADELILRVKGLAEKGTSTKPGVRAWIGVLSLTT
jgi:hypothetical protein